MSKQISRKVVWVLAPVLVAGILVGGRAVVSAADRQEAENKARTYVPEDAALQGKERDDGAYKFHFYSESTGYSYEVEISRSSGEVREVESELRGGTGSSNVSLTEADIQGRVREWYPEAEISGMQLGQDDGLYSYEVYFRADDKYGSLELNAAEGTLLESKIKYGTPVVIPAETSNVTADTSYLSEEEIRNQVAGAYPDSQLVAVEMDRDDGRYVYEVEFFSGGWKYDLVYDALTGEVLKEESEQTNWQPAETAAAPAESAEETPASTETQVPESSAAASGGENRTETGAASGTSGQPVSEEKAREIAIGKASAENPDADWSGSITKIRLDRDDGRLLYEGELRSGAIQCEFEIDAYTGVVLKWETEVKGNPQNGQSAGADAQTIGQDAASAIALGKAQAGDAWIVEIQLEEDDGRLLYEGEMRDSSYEYEFEIDAYTGTVIQWEVEGLGR